MRAHLCAFVFLVLSAGCVEQNRCCLDDGGCDLGARCFEGQCAPSCSSSSDCLSGESCIRGACVGDVLGAQNCRAAQTCTNDAQEPNDNVAEATTVLVARIYDGRLCTQDEDVFALPVLEREATLVIEGNVRIAIDDEEVSNPDNSLRLNLDLSEQRVVRISGGVGSTYTLEVLR